MFGRGRLMFLVVFLAVLPLASCTELAYFASQLDAAQPQSSVVGDAVRGESLFQLGVYPAPPCSTCHLVTVGGSGFSLAPNLQDIGTTTSSRDTTVDAESYIRESILDPKAYVVSGYRVSMFDEYQEYLSEQDIADLVAYLMSL